MKYDIETVENILEGIKKDPLKVIYTENYLNQIAKRNIPDMPIEELIENGKLSEITEIQNSTFELHFDLEDSNELKVIAEPFNIDEIILISASYKNNGINHQSHHVIEFEGIYDLALDLMDFHSKYGFKYKQTVEMEPGFYIDFDSGGHPVAIEMTPTSKRFKLNRKSLSSVKFDGRIEITPELIEISLKASFNSESIKTRVFEKEIPNEYGIQANVFDLMIEMDE